MERGTLLISQCFTRSSFCAFGCGKNTILVRPWDSNCLLPADLTKLLDVTFSEKKIILKIFILNCIILKGIIFILFTLGKVTYFFAQDEARVYISQAAKIQGYVFRSHQG